MTRPATPIPTQNVFQRNAGGDQRSDDELPGRSAGHAEHLRGADERRRARRREVRRRDVDRADQREYAARALQEPARRSPRYVLPDANSSAPMPTTAAPSGTTLRGPSRSIATPATRLNGE